MDDLMVHTYYVNLLYSYAKFKYDSNAVTRLIEEEDYYSGCKFLDAVYNYLCSEFVCSFPESKRRNKVLLLYSVAFSPTTFSHISTNYYFRAARNSKPRIGV